MKKIINSILAFVTLFSVTSCDLDMDPETAIRPEDAYTIDHSAALAVLDPEGRMAGVVQAPLEPAAIAADLAALTGEALQ